MSHCPNHNTTRHREKTQNREQPAIPNGINERLCNNTANARKDVADKVVRRDTRRRFSWHEFRQHSRCHAKDEHGANAKKEIGDELC